MLNVYKITYLNTRTFKNFGHKRQPVSMFTTLWHGFLTFTFIGLGINWKRYFILFILIINIYDFCVIKCMKFY